MSNVIPTVPTTEINLSKDGLKNLAGWIARFMKIENNDYLDLFPAGCITEGFKIDELLHNGDLIKYEPSLVKYKGEGECRLDQLQYTFEPYEFELSHTGESFLIEQNDNEVFVLISFTFLANNKVSIHASVECCMVKDDKHKHVRISFFEKYLNSFGIYDFLVENESIHKEVSWLEADKIISIISSEPQIPSVPGVIK